RLLCLCVTAARAPTSPLFPYPTLFRSPAGTAPPPDHPPRSRDRLRVLVRARDFSNDVRPVRGGAVRVRSRSDRLPLCRHEQAERSEEHTSELQSRVDLVCRLLLEKKKR